MTADGRVPTIGAQIGKITAHAFGARKDDQIRRRNGLARPDKLQVHLRVQTQRVEIGVIADSRQHRHDHIQHLLHLVGLTLIYTVFGLKVQVHHIRQHANHWFAGTLLQPVESRLQQGNVASKTIDDETFDPSLFRGGQQFKGSDQMRKHPATVDVSDQNHRAVDRFGKAHIGNITGSQVDLCR